MDLSWGVMQQGRGQELPGGKWEKWGLHLGNEAASCSHAHTHMSAAVSGLRFARLHTAELLSPSNFPMIDQI